MSILIQGLFFNITATALAIDICFLIPRLLLGKTSITKSVFIVHLIPVGIIPCENKKKRMESY